MKLWTIFGSLMLAGALAACGDSSAISSLRPDLTPAKTRLTVDEPLIFDQPVKDAKGYQRQHIMAFGNWTAQCFYQRRSGSKPFARCELAPWNGKLLQGRPVPLMAMAIVDIRKGEAARLKLMTEKRREGQAFIFFCGGQRFAEVSKPGPIVPVDKETGLHLIRAMKQNDCTIGYTRHESGQVMEFTFLSYGFTEAESYARRYVMSPN